MSDEKRSDGERIAVLETTVEQAKAAAVRRSGYWQDTLTDINHGIMGIRKDIGDFKVGFAAQPQKCMAEVDGKLKEHKTATKWFVGIVLTVVIAAPGVLWAAAQLVQAVAAANGGP